MARKDTDPDAFEELYVRNLRFVVSIVRGMVYNENDLMDMISIGNGGLRDAITKFDPTVSTAKLSTYAGWWIKQRLLRAFPAQRMIRVPVHVASQYVKLNRISAKMAEELGRPPTADEIHEETGTSLKKIHEWEQSSAPVSLDAALEMSDGEGSTRGDLIADENAHMASDSVGTGDDFASVVSAMRTCLTDVQYDVLMSRYGLKDGGKGDVLEAIGKKYRVTRERIRQIQNKALQLVRDHIRRSENEFTASTNRTTAPQMGSSGNITRVVRKDGIKIDRDAFVTESTETKGWSLPANGHNSPFSPAFLFAMKTIDYNPVEVSKRIKGEREAQGFKSARLFAEQKGISTSNYCNAECRPTMVSNDFLSRVATALGVRYDWLMHETGEKKLSTNEVNPTVAKGGRLKTTPHAGSAGLETESLASCMKQFERIKKRVKEVEAEMTQLVKDRVIVRAKIDKFLSED